MTLRIDQDSMTIPQADVTAYQVDRVLDGRQTWACPLWPGRVFLRNQMISALTAIEIMARDGMLVGEGTPADWYAVDAYLAEAELVRADLPAVTTWDPECAFCGGRDNCPRCTDPAELDYLD